MRLGWCTLSFLEPEQSYNTRRSPASSQPRQVPTIALQQYYHTKTEGLALVDYSRPESE